MFPSLYPVLDSSFLPSTGKARELWLRAIMAELISSGVTLLQYRNKLGDESEILDDAAVLRDAAPAGECRLVLNDYPELAVLAGFDGVHVGQEDILPDQARTVIGPARMVGVSTHNPTQLSAAASTSADYVAIGPVFRTNSKANLDPVVGLDGVRLARSFTAKPLVAIGGITVDNCRSVIDAGADSVAVISALFGEGSRVEDIVKDFWERLR